MKYSLALDQVSKAYPASGFALKDISFALPEGSILGFIGQNGAGKSTTIGCILNSLKKDGGSIRIFGREMGDKDTDIREDIGVVYDSNNFPEYFRPKQLAGIFGDIYKNWDHTLFQTYLSRFALAENQMIKEYSRGMKMKLAMAVALAHRPKLLVLDEATSGLDPIMRDEILDVLLDFVKEEDHSILVSSHITSDLEKIADYIVLIHEGQIILNTSKDKLIYEYGLVRCSDQDFPKLDPQDIVAYRKKDYQVDVLVADKDLIRKKHGQLIIDHTSLDEIMLLLVKGERI